MTRIYRRQGIARRRVGTPLAYSMTATTGTWSAATTTCRARDFVEADRVRWTQLVVLLNGGREAAQVHCLLLLEHMV